MSGMMSLVMYFLKRHYPASIKGLTYWSTALLILFTAGIFAAGAGVFPVFISITLAGFLLGFGLFLAYLGTLEFFGEKPRMSLWIALILVATLIQAWFTYVEPSYHIRLVTSNLLASFLFGLHAHLIFRQGLFTFARKLAFCVLVFMLAMQVMRFGTSFLESIGDNVLYVSPYHQIYVTSFAFGILLFSIGMVLLATERLREELEHLATHDSLTDAFTRRHMNEALAQELERSRRQGRDLSLLAMDLDHFKSINDTYGHQAGDRVLIEFVADVKTLLRRHDQLGRFGGEEFVVLLPETAAETAAAIAERIRLMMATRKSGCTVSIGVTSRLNDADTVDALLARADAAMYRAKANGRNRIEQN